MPTYVGIVLEPKHLLPNEGCHSFAAQVMPQAVTLNKTPKCSHGGEHHKAGMDDDRADFVDVAWDRNEEASEKSQKSFRRVSLQRKDGVGSDASGARLLGEVVGIPLRVQAEGAHAATEIGFGGAPVTLLHVLDHVFGCASRQVAGEHAEALGQTELARPLG